MSSADHPHSHANPTPAAAAAPNPTKDPVCGMTVDPAHAAGKAEHMGETYYFCSDHCRAAFVRDPERYLRGASGKA